MDLVPPEADPATLGDGDRLVVERVVELLQAAVGLAGAGVELGRELHAERLVRALLVVFVDEGVELRLLLEEVVGGRLGGFLLERQMHALMAAVLLRMPGSDPLDLDPEA